MLFDGALVNKQGKTFAIVAVKSNILKMPSEREAFRSSCSAIFPGIPIILMAQDARNIPTYHGREDIVGFLANTTTKQIHWKRYTMS